MKKPSLFEEYKAERDLELHNQRYDARRILDYIYNVKQSVNFVPDLAGNEHNDALNDLINELNTSLRRVEIKMRKASGL